MTDPAALASEGRFVLVITGKIKVKVLVLSKSEYAGGSRITSVR